MALFDLQALRIVTQSISQYRKRKLDIEGLQLNIASFMTALEGDVPLEIRETIYNAEASIELIRFTLDSVE